MEDERAIRTNRLRADGLIERVVSLDHDERIRTDERERVLKEIESECVWNRNETEASIEPRELAALLIALHESRR